MPKLIILCIKRHIWVSMFEGVKILKILVTKTMEWKDIASCTSHFMQLVHAGFRKTFQAKTKDSKSHDLIS